jgi:type III pantothenate kinase
MDPDATPRWLLLDLGNSRLKWTWATDARVGAIQAAVHGAPGWLRAAHADWAAGAAPRRILLSSVAIPALAAEVRAVLARCRPQVEVEAIASPADAGDWRSAYAQPDRLGVDRYLAMRGAIALQSGAVLVVGCGTAVTIDLVDAQGRHRGGLIAPGPALMRQSIVARAGRVDWQREGRLQAFGTDTEDALQSGCWQAAAGLVERALAAATGELGAAVTTLLHGGDAEQLASLLGRAVRIVPQLVFEGMLRHAR